MYPNAAAGKCAPLSCVPWHCCLPGSTDSKWFRVPGAPPLRGGILRMVPLTSRRSERDLERFHAANERARVGDYCLALRVMHRALRLFGDFLGASGHEQQAGGSDEQSIGGIITGSAQPGHEEAAEGGPATAPGPQAAGPARPAAVQHDEV